MNTRSGFCLLVFASLISATSAAVHFKHWYPQYRPVFELIMEEHCQAEYHGYLTKVAPPDENEGQALFFSPAPFSACTQIQARPRGDPASFALVVGPSNSQIR